MGAGSLGCLGVVEGEDGEVPEPLGCVDAEQKDGVEKRSRTQKRPRWEAGALESVWC